MIVSSLPLSPCLTRLQSELEQGNMLALEYFWQEVERRGGPLIELVEHDPAQMLVSFLWRDPGDTRSVVVIGGPAYLGDDDANQMQRFLATDLWYKTYQVPADLRATYKFLVNKTLTLCQEEQDLLQYALLSDVDPLNPRKTSAPLVLPGKDRRAYVSILELPLAPTPIWTRAHAHVPRGHIKLLMLESKILKNKYHLAIYTPPGYVQVGKPYNLLFLFDSWMYMEAIPVSTIMDNLLYAGSIDPYIVVMHSHLDYVTRNRELSYSRPFTDFLAQEFVPWLHQHYHVAWEPEHNIVGGVSLGGVAAAFVGFMCPELFGNVLAQSGSFGATMATMNGEWIIEQFACSPKLPLRFSLEVGSLERTVNFDHVTANLRLRDILRARGYEVSFTEFHGGHDAICWRESFAERLLCLQKP